MNPQKKLLDTADKHRNNPAVSVFLASIREAQSDAKRYLAFVNASSKTFSCAANLEDGFSVPLDSTELVQSAAKASAEMARLASDFMNLATVLQSLGEKIDY